jgi:hypothetical protein
MTVAVVTPALSVGAAAHCPRLYHGLPRACRSTVLHHSLHRPLPTSYLQTHAGTQTAHTDLHHDTHAHTHTHGDECKTIPVQSEVGVLLTF